MHTNKPLTTGCCPDGTGYIKLHIGVKTEETEQHSEKNWYVVELQLYM